MAILSLLCGGCGTGARPGDDGAASVRERRAVAQVRANEPTVLVDVAGHVRRPGVYRLAAGARVHEAIGAAGGVRPGADLAALNRAAPVTDGQQVLVPARGAGGDGAGASDAGAGAGSGTVSINSADAAALDQLPGIGPVTAERIVADREANGPFASVDDLDRVSGVGPATIEALREVAAP